MTAARDWPDLVAAYPANAECVVTVNGRVDPNYTRVHSISRGGYVRCWAPAYGPTNPVTCEFRPEEVEVR